MGSLSRKSRRKLERKGSISVHDIVRRDAELITDNVMRKIESDYRPKVVGEYLLLLMSYFHIKKGFGNIQLKGLLRSFDTFCDDMARDKTTTDQLRDMLIEEAGFDVIAEYQRISDETEKRKEAKKT